MVTEKPDQARTLEPVLPKGALEKGLKVLCEEFYDSLGFEIRPTILLDAIKKKNMPVIEMLIHAMSKAKRRFFCDDCFEADIKNDLVLVAKQLIQNGWHKPTKANLELSKKLYGKMW